MVQNENVETAFVDAEDAPTLTETELDILRSERVAMTPLTNVWPGTRGYYISGLVRMGYLGVTKKITGRRWDEDVTYYGPTSKARELLGDGDATLSSTKDEAKSTI